MDLTVYTHNTVQKFEVSIGFIYLLKQINTLLKQGSLMYIQLTANTFIMLEMDFQDVYSSFLLILFYLEHQLSFWRFNVFIKICIILQFFNVCVWKK